MHEFTATEVFSALRRLMPERDAWMVAEAATGPVNWDEVRSSPPVRPSGEGLAYVPVPSGHFIGDTLILLSFVSAEAALKVERYREWLRGGAPPDAAEDAAWEARRAVLAAWRDDGYPRGEDLPGESASPRPDGR